MKRIKILLLLVLLLSVLYSGHAFGWIKEVIPENIRLFVLPFGNLAPIIFVGLFTIAPLVPIFSAVLAITGGLIFGLWYGSVLIMIGAFLGGTVGFFIARKWGSFLQQHKDEASLHTLEAALKHNGFLLIFLLRLIPLFPFDVISYGAGFSPVRYRDYILATMIGIIPGVLVYANIGANTMQINSPAFFLSLSLLACLTVLSLLLKKRLKKKFPL